MLKQYQFKTVHAHKNEYSQFFSEWDLELFSTNTSVPLLNWVSFVLLALKGKKPCYFMFAIRVDWKVLDWSQGPPDLNPWLGLLPFMLRGQNIQKCLWKCCTSSSWIPAAAPREAQEHLLITGFFQRHFFTARTKESAASWAECEWHTQLKILLPFWQYLFPQHIVYICGVGFLWIFDGFFGLGFLKKI